MLTLGGACTKAGGLTSLRSFTLAIHPDHPIILAEAIELLLKKSRVEVFQSYMPSSDALAGQLCVRVVNQHRDHLVRLCFHPQSIPLATLEHVCISCPRLEDLFVAVHILYPAEMACFPFSFLVIHSHRDHQARFISILAKATHLRTVYIYPVDLPHAWDPLEYALDIVRQCSPTISPVGIETGEWTLWRVGLLLY